MPRSRASLRNDGEAYGSVGARPVEGFAAADCSAPSGGAVSAASAGAAVAAASGPAPPSHRDDGAAMPPGPVSAPDAALKLPAPASPRSADPVSRSTGVPAETVSPTLSSSSPTTPATGAGTSIIALSDSISSSGSSGRTLSPTFTNTSTTGTSWKLPRSGTQTSWSLIVRLPGQRSPRPRRRCIGVDASIADRYCDHVHR